MHSQANTIIDLL